MMEGVPIDEYLNKLLMTNYVSVCKVGQRVCLLI